MAHVLRLLTIFALLVAAVPTNAQEDDAVLLVAHPAFRDLDYRQTVVLASPRPTAATSA
jgi:hypothetical protein